MLLASCGTDIKFHKWPSGHYHSSFQFPETGTYKPNISWCSEGELLATTVPSMGFPLVMHVGKSIQTYMVIEIKEVQALSFSRVVQNYITLGNAKGNIALYDIQQQEILQQLHPLPSGVTFLEYGAMDSCLAAGCTNGQIYLFNASYNISSTYCVPDSNDLTAMTYHRKQQNLLAAAGSDGIVVVWDSITGNAEILDKSHTNSITDLAFSFGNDMATVGLDHKLNGYDLRTKSIIFSCTSDVQLTSVCFFPTGDQIAVASANGKLFCYDRRKIKYPFNTIVTHHPKKVSRIAFQIIENDYFVEEPSSAESVTTVYYSGHAKCTNSVPIGDMNPIKKVDSSLSVERPSKTDFQTPASGDYGPHTCKSHDISKIQKENYVHQHFINPVIPNASEFVNINRQPGCTNLVGETPTTNDLMRDNIRFVGASFKQNAVSSWVKQITKSSSQGNIDRDNDISQVRNELVDFTTDTFDRLNTFVNKQFLKIRLAVSKGFIQMEQKMNERWEELNSSIMQFSDCELFLEGVNEGDIEKDGCSSNKLDVSVGQDEIEKQENGTITELKSRIPVLNSSVK